MKKIFALLLVVLSLSLTLLATSCVLDSNDTNGSSSNNSSGGIFNSTKKVELVGTPQMYVEYNSYLGYSAEIKGTLKNNTSKSYSYVSVEFVIYDSNNNNLGTALANMNNLQPGDTWNFTATLFSYPETEPTSFKLIDITNW